MTIDKASQDLLMAVVRNATDPAAIRALADGIGDWDELVDLAQRHCVLPTLFTRLPDLDPFVPASARERIQRANDQVIVHNLRNAAELIAVLQLFDGEGIQAMPFKGVVLAASVYGDLLKRPGGDLDVLVRKSDLERATKALCKRGYELETPLRADGRPKERKSHEYKFRRWADGMELELRWRLDLNWGRYGRELGVEWVWPRHATTMLAGAAVPIFNPEVSLVVLCMHGCKHDWSRLVWVCDVAKTIAAYPELDWKFVFAEAKRLGLRRAVGLGILLAERLLQARIPQSVLERYKDDLTTQRFADHFATNLLENPGMAPAGRIPYGFQLLDSWDRFRLLLSLDFLRPNERDRAAFELPKSLRPLYFLIRPFRLLRDRSAR